MTTSPPPDWYPDPEQPGFVRYWDGIRWTDHRSPVAGPPRPALAGFGARAAALIIDGLILSVPFVVLMVVVFFVFAATAGTALDGSTGTVEGGAVAMMFLLFGALMLAMIAVPLLYATGFEAGLRGQTIGKWAMGIRVVDATTAGRVRPSRAFVRTLVRSFASGAIFYLGYLWALWDEENRTWHDMAADTRVVEATGDKGTLGELLRSWSLRA